MEILKDFKRENIIYTTSREKYLKSFEEKGYKTLSVETYGTTKDGSIYPLDSNWEGSSYLNIFDIVKKKLFKFLMFPKKS